MRGAGRASRSERVHSGALECLTVAALCVRAAVNRIIGGAPGGVALKESAKRYIALSDWTNAGLKSSTLSSEDLG
jgi:hypothetical protein